MTRTRLGTRLGTALGAAARRLRLSRPAVRLACAVLRRLEPGHPVLTRAEAVQAAQVHAIRAAVTADLQARADTVRRSAHMPQRGRWRKELTEEQGTVPDGYAQGRADLQLTHRPTVVPREEWERDGLEATIARHAQEDPHAGRGDMHVCRCDSWRIPPAHRGRPHACRCTDSAEGSHLPSGAPPFINPAGGAHDRA